MSDKQENDTVNEGTGDQEFTVGNLEKNLTADEKVVQVKTLERCFNEMIDREMNNLVDAVEVKVQNTSLTAIDNFATPKIELAIRSIHASFGQDATSVTANSERGEHIGITALFENILERNITLHMLNVNDETRNNNPGEASELSVPGTHFDRKPHIHHN